MQLRKETWYVIMICGYYLTGPRTLTENRRSAAV